MFSPGGLKSLDIKKDFELMQELTYHQSLQSEHLPPSLDPETK